MSKLIRISDELHTKLSRSKGKSYSELIENLLGQTEQVNKRKGKLKLSSKKSFSTIYPIIDSLIILRLCPDLINEDSQKILLNKLSKSSAERKEAVKMIRKHPSQSETNFKFFRIANSNRRTILSEINYPESNRKELKTHVLKDLKDKGWIERKNTNLNSVLDNRLMYLRNQRLINYTSKKGQNWQGGSYSASRDIPFSVWSIIFSYQKLKSRKSIILKQVQNDICHICTTDFSL